MGCGAVCGSSSTVAESSKQGHTQFIRLFKQITPNQFLYPVRAIAKFAKQMQVYPHRLQLLLTEKLEAKNLISPGVMQKWKIIMFGLDCDRTSYINCLGYPATHAKPKLSIDKQDNDSSTIQGSPAQASTEQPPLVQHKAFTQIEKDIQRTFPGIELEKASFTTVLKRITNHFPKMGYTQGINFIVGYLLIVGFSQTDTFWFFIHMALNRRYMILGLYEDGFPLINTYTCIFRNLLKRLNSGLYQHLYQNIVMFEQSAWVFKWFMTCYLSSFPIQMCQFVWDLVISLGAIALVKFGISLVLKLQKQLMMYDDACDISEFFSSLRDIQTFNKYLCIREVVKDAYTIQVEYQDLDELRHVKTQRGGNNFYAEYILLKFEEEQSQNVHSRRLNDSNELAKASEQLHQTNPVLFKKLSGSRSTQLLNQWYDKLTKQRLQFICRAHPSSSILSVIKDQSILIQNSSKFTSKLQVNNISEAQIPKNSKTSIQQFTSVANIEITDHPFRNQKRKQSDSSTGVGKMDSLQASPNNKISKIGTNRYSTKKPKAEDLWKDDDDQLIEQTKDKMVIDDEFFYAPPRDAGFKRKKIIKKQAQDILSQYLQPASKPKQNNYIPKTTYLRPDSCTDTNNPNLNQNNSNSHSGGMQNSRLARVGHSVLSNMSVSNVSGRSSNSSYRTVHKENSINSGRYCKCAKNKTQHNQVQIPISKPMSRKNIQRVDQPQDIQDIGDKYDQSADFGSVRKRMNTYHDWMVNSQGPREKTINIGSSNVKQACEIGSEVEILQGREMFKKKNRGPARVGGGVSVIPRDSVNIHEKEVSQCQSRHMPTPAFYQQESCESFVIGMATERKSQIAQIQSVK